MATSEEWQEIVDMWGMCREENWWEISEFKEKPFDAIFDCAGDIAAWQHARAQKVLKGGRQGGRFIAVAPEGCASSLSRLAACGPVFVFVHGRFVL